MISSILFTISGALFLIGLLCFALGWLFCILLPPEKYFLPGRKTIAEYLAIFGFCLMQIAICFGSVGGITTLIESVWYWI